MGKVYLIGTGPGDEELLTLKAVRVLKECTAVLYDRLGSGNIFKYLRADCKVFYCGKEPNCHYKPQGEINEMLVQLIKEGHIVGRIKGGDPYVFGRGGEEALRLLQEDIDFEVVPGITSPISVLSYAGIPITHRGLSQHFHVYTGKSARKLNIDWEHTAKTGGTMVFMMGLENIQSIVENLIQNSMDENTKAAVIMRGTSSKQRKVVGTLKDIGQKSKEAGLKSPCIIVIGEVVSLSSKLQWYENKPLFGLNICITRSKDQSKEISEEIIKLGGDVTEINSIEIKNTDYYLEAYLDKLGNYDYLVFTSVNAVNVFFNYLIKKNMDVRKIKGKLASIGEATYEAIKSRGVISDIIAKESTSEGLLKEMSQYIKRGDKVIIPGSTSSRDVLEKGLQANGAIVDRVGTYDTTIGKVKNPNIFEEVDVVIFTSPSTVRNMVELVGMDNIKKKIAIAIGPITEKELKDNNIQSVVCKEQSIDGIINELRRVKDA